MSRRREEVLNSTLADVLIHHGLNANAESISRSNKRPDVLVNIEGLNVWLEGRSENQKFSLFQTVNDRIREGLTSFCLGVTYPERLFDQIQTPQSALNQALSETHFDGKLEFLTNGSPSHVELNQYSVEQITDLLNNSADLVVRSDIFANKVQEIEGVFDQTSELAQQDNLFQNAEALEQRLRNALGGQ